MKIVSTGGTISTFEYLEKKLRARRRRWVFTGFSLLILLIVAVVLSRQEKLRIQEVLVTGAHVTPVEDISAAATEALAGYYFWLVPKDNAVIYPRAYVRSVLSRTFSRLSSVSLSLTGLTVLNIDVVEREPFALYCKEVLVSVEDSPSCYFLDETGFIFDSAPFFSTGVYFIYALETPLENPLGVAIMPQAEFEILDKFIVSLEPLLGQSQGVSLSPTEARLFLEHKLTLLWRREDDMSHLLSNLESFLTSPTIKEQKNFLQNLEELDLRTEDKVFYKFRN